MDENNEVMTEGTVADAEEISTTDEDNWDDVDLSDLTDTAEETNEEQEEPAEEEPTEEEPTEEKTPEAEPDADQRKEPEDGEQETFELKHLGETRAVGRQEMTALAQKGMDYDHVRGERDAARERVQELEGFLNELTGGGMTIEELMDQTRAEVLSQREGIDKTVALERVRLDRDRKALEAERAKGEKARADRQAEEQRRRDDLSRFVREFPGVDVNTVPKEIWLEVGKGSSLTDEYRKYENEQLKAKISELETKAKNEENKKRSTGSQSTAGNGPKTDKWFEGWDD